MPPPPTFDVPFLGGVSTKFPPNLVPPGALIQAWNTAMRKQGEISKRFGSQSMLKPPQSSLNWTDAFGIGVPGSTALGNELLISGPVGASGVQQHGWSPASGQWLQKGTAQPIAVTEKTAYAGDVDCQATDLALNFDTPVAGGCYGCYVYQTPTGVSFTVVDDKNGQTVMANQSLASISVGPFPRSPRVVAVGPYFVVFVMCPSGANTILLAYLIDPFQKTVNQFGAPIVSANMACFDARVVTNAPANVGHNGIYVSVAAGFASGNWALIQVDPWLQTATPVAGSVSATIVSIALGIFPANIGVILNTNNSTINIQWFNLSGAPGNTEQVDVAATGYAPWGKLTLQPTPLGFTAAWETLGTLDNAGDFLTLPSIRTASGTVAAGDNCVGACIKRNHSIAGDLFVQGGQTYLPVVYQGNYGTGYTQMFSLQPTYLCLQIVSSFATAESIFTTTAVATEQARFAQDNAGGPTANRMCPQASTDLAGNIVWGCGLGTQQTAAFNGAWQNVRAVARAVFTFGVQQFSTTLGDNMHMTGGFLWAYDGSGWKEHNFHETPEPARVDCCNIACCRVQLGTGSSLSSGNAAGFIGDSGYTGGENPPAPWGALSGLIFTAIAAPPGGTGIYVTINPIDNSLLPTYVSPASTPTNIIIIPQTNGTVVTDTNQGVINALAAFNAANPAKAVVTAAITPSTTGSTLLANFPGNNYCTTASTGGSPTLDSIQLLQSYTVNPTTATATLSPGPVTPGTVYIFDSQFQGGTTPIGVDNGVAGSATGTIGPINGATGITGTITYATGVLSVTLSYSQSGGAISASWNFATGAYAETNDVYFPPDTANPGEFFTGSGWQVRPSSYVVITAQSNGVLGTAWQPPGYNGYGGPYGYVWFSVDGIGADPAPFSNAVLIGANVQCRLLSTDTAAQCAAKFRQVILGSFAAVVTPSQVIQNVSPPTGVSTGVTSKVTLTCVLGTTWAPGAPVTYSEDFRSDPSIFIPSGQVGAGWISCPGGNKIMPGGYFVVPCGAVNGGTAQGVLVFYYTVNGLGTAPIASQVLLPQYSGAALSPGQAYNVSIIGNPIAIAVNSYSTQIQVANATQAALNTASGANFGVFVSQQIPGYLSEIIVNVAPAAFLFGNQWAPYGVSVAGILPDGQYQYGACEEWNDTKGQLHQSGVSEIVIVNIQGASPTFDPYGLRYDAAGSALSQASNLHGMLLWGAPVGGCSPYLITPSFWATQKQGVTLAQYRSTVNPASPVAFFRVTDQSLQAVATTASAIVNPNPLAPGATAANPLTGTFLPLDMLTFIDTTPDVQAQGNPGLYTNGGNYSYAPVPSCSYLHVHQGRLWSLSTEAPNQAWVSNVYVSTEQDAVEFCEQIIEEIDPALGQCVSLGSCDDKLIELCQYGLFYLTGAGPSPSGVGDFNVPQRIMCEVGAVSPVFLETFDGFWWQSQNGLYFCNRNLEASYRGAPVEDLVNPYGKPQMYLQSAVISPNGQTELRFFFVQTKGAANPATDYCVAFNWITNWWAPSRKFAANSATIWYPPQQSPTMVFVDGSGNVKQETPNHFLDDGAPISRTIQCSWWGAQGTGTKQGYFMMPQGVLLGRFGGMPTPISSKVQVLIGFDYEQPSTPVTWDQTALLAPPTNSPLPQGDGMVAQFRFFIPPGPRGGTMEAISFTISDVVNQATPDDPGFLYELLTCEIIPLGGSYRLGPLRTTG